MSIDFVNLMFASLFLTPRRPVEAKIQSKSCAREFMTHYLSKTRLSFDALLSADKLRVYLLAERIEHFDER
jgi:hypothetical protein